MQEGVPVPVPVHSFLVDTGSSIGPEACKDNRS